MRDEAPTGGSADDADGRPTFRMIAGELGAPAGPERDAPPGDDDRPDEGGGGATGEARPGEIYPGSPVLALGKLGEVHFYLDTLGQLIPIKGHTRDNIRCLFGGFTDGLQAAYPQKAKGGHVTGWSHELVAAAMQRACAQKGVWDAFERVRGPGAWADDDGGLILHCGNAILYRNSWRAPGEIDGYVYPSHPAIPRPLPRSELDFAPGGEILEMVSTWRWERKELDAYMLLGWLAAAIVGGALKWRPLIYITGGSGTGKSTLQEVMRQVLGGEGAMLQSSDATEPSIRQALRHSTIPVLLDEFEPEPGSNRKSDMMKLARAAASGAVAMRGSADHKAQEFRARSVFAFSSINPVPLLDQDISRIAMLELQPLPRGVPAPKLDKRRLRRLGRGLRTRIGMQWERLHETVELYRRAMADVGHSARGSDQYGTLLALADLAMHDDIPTPERCESWARQIRAEDIAEQMDQQGDEMRWLTFLLSQPLEVHRGGRQMSVATWVRAAADLVTDPEEDAPTPGEARRVLPDFGLRVEGVKRNAWLWVANDSARLERMHQGTTWEGRGWATPAKRLPGSKPTGQQRYNGLQYRGRAIPLTVMPSLLGEERDARSATAHPDPIDGLTPDEFGA